MSYSCSTVILELLGNREVWGLIEVDDLPRILNTNYKIIDLKVKIFYIDHSSFDTDSGFYNSEKPSCVCPL